MVVQIISSLLIMWGERTHQKHHQAHAPSGSSKEKIQDKRQAKFIPDKYSSVDEVTSNESPNMFFCISLNSKQISLLL